MNFLATVNNFVVANETAVLVSVALALVLFQLALIVAAFVSEEPHTDENDVVDLDNEEAWVAYYAYHPMMF